MDPPVVARDAPDLFVGAVAVAVPGQLDALVVASAVVVRLVVAPSDVLRAEPFFVALGAVAQGAVADCAGRVLFVESVGLGADPFAAAVGVDHGLCPAACCVDHF